VVASPVHAGVAWVTENTYPPAVGVTLDGGRTWIGAPGLSGSRFAIGADPSVWWIGNGDVELQRSADRGATWQVLPSFSVARGPIGRVSIAHVIADPMRPDVVFVVLNVGDSALGGQQILESADGGATWERWHPYLPEYSKEEAGYALTWRDIPGRDELLLARTGVTARGGAYDALDVVSANGVRHLLFHHGYSINDKTDHKITSGLDLTPRMDVDLRGTDILLESRRSGWLISTDAGAHFGPLGHSGSALEAAPAFDPSTPGRVFAVHAGRMWRSDDDGGHWVGLDQGFPGATGMTIDAAGELYVWGDSGFAISDDHGNSFRRSGTFGVPVPIAAVRRTADTGRLVATLAGVFRVSPSGQWSSVDRAILPLSALSVAPLGRTRGVIVLRAPLYGDPTSLEAQMENNSGLPGRLEISRDGVTWIRIRLPPSVAQHLDLSSYTRLRSDSRGLRITLASPRSLITASTTDGGRHWHLGRI
jgi:hypothetical protein